METPEKSHTFTGARREVESIHGGPVTVWDAASKAFVPFSGITDRPGEWAADIHGVHRLDDAGARTGEGYLVAFS